MSDSDMGSSASSTSGIGRKLVEPLIRAVRAEIASARAEIAGRVRVARAGIILVSAGALLGIITVMLLGALSVAVLALALPVWAACLIACAVFAAMTGLLLGSGLRMLRRGLPAVPSDTLGRAKKQLSSTRASEVEHR